MASKAVLHQEVVVEWADMSKHILNDASQLKNVAEDSYGKIPSTPAVSLDVFTVLECFCKPTSPCEKGNFNTRSNGQLLKGKTEDLDLETVNRELFY